MDKERQIRFLYPPLIFLGSLVFGSYLDDSITLESIFKGFPDLDKTLNVVLTILGAGSLILLLGYLLGTITIFILKWLFKLKGKDLNYEELLSEEYYEKIATIILVDKDKPLEKKDRLYAVCTFDHSIVSPGVHQWIVRRWNAFLIQTSSTVAIFFSFIIGVFFLNIDFNWAWLAVSGLFFCVLLWLAYTAWQETMRMIEFQTRVIGGRNEEANKKDDILSKPKTNLQYEQYSGETQMPHVAGNKTDS